MIFGKIEGIMYGDWTWVGDKNRALLALLFARQAREVLTNANYPDREIVIFSGRKRGREYMGWRTGSSPDLNVVERAIV